MVKLAHDLQIMVCITIFYARISNDMKHAGFDLGANEINESSLSSRPGSELFAAWLT